jgi:hypothetical protein
MNVLSAVFTPELLGGLDIDRSVAGRGTPRSERYLDMALIVSTERLGLLGDDASWSEHKETMRVPAGLRSHHSTLTAPGY